MSRVTQFSLAGAAAAVLLAGSLTTASAAPVPAMSASTLAGGTALDQVQYRGYGYRGGYRGYGGGYGYRGGYGVRGYGPRYGYGYRRGFGGGGALAAGAALGIIGAAAAASTYPAYGYPAYGYSYPAYGGYYGQPAYYYPY